jgi:hypothetical protein
MKEKEKGEKKKENREKGKEGKRKRVSKIRRNPRKFRRKGEKVFYGVFWFFGCWRNFRDGGDGEAGWPAGPRQVRDSRRGGRQRRWGGTR